MSKHSGVDSLEQPSANLAVSANRNNAAPSSLPGRIKMLLVLLAIALGADGAVKRLTMIDTASGAIFYFCLYGLLLAAFVAAAYCRPFWLRLLFGVLFAASVQFYESFRLTADIWPTYDTYVIMLESMGFAGNAWDHHRLPLLQAAAHAAVVLLAVAINPRHYFRWARQLALAPLAAIALLSSMLFARGGDGANGLPPSFPGIAFSVIHIVDGILSPELERGDITLAPQKPPAARDLIYIIDESVLGTYLDINHPDGVYSGLDRTEAGVSIANFGIAASIALCSSSVNYTLRHGGSRADYANMNATLPSIFAYAQNAGMHTVYLDAQAIPGLFSNLMYQAELDLVDQHVTMNFTPVLQRDQKLAEEIINLTNDDKSSFILINKVGAHFPVQDKYPDSHLIYKPVSSRGNYVNISDTGDRAGFSGDPEAWRLYRNAYRNTLLWNTGEFFDRIFDEANLQDTVIIYTSDHGQRLHEDGSPGQNTHCSPQPRDEEGAVPLVFITPERLGSAFEQAAVTHHNATSHYRLFSTALGLMGYSEADVSAIYGPDITANVPDEYTYNAYFNARMGRKPVWRKLKMDNVATPLASDVDP